jgi:predicted transcriptional regulator
MSKTTGLTSDDSKKVNLLVNTGMSKNVAKTLIFLSKRKETTSVDIEINTGLRQPEVSIAMQELRRRKWITKRDIKKEGKGRPVHSYHLAVPFSEIINVIEKAERQRIEKIKENMDALKRLTM